MERSSLGITKLRTEQSWLLRHVFCLNKVEQTEDTIEMSNKKLVFKIDIDHPDYEALSELSASVRSGDVSAMSQVDLASGSA